MGKGPAMLHGPECDIVGRKCLFGWILQVGDSRWHNYLLGYQIGLENLHVQSCNFVSLFASCLKQRLSLDICCTQVKMINLISSSLLKQFHLHHQFKFFLSDDILFNSYHSHVNSVLCSRPWIHSMQQLFLRCIM